MPNFDGTGPAGQGSKTGAQQGKCESTKPQTHPLDGRGESEGQGQGRGRGRKGGFFARFRRGGKGQEN